MTAPSSPATPRRSLVLAGGGMRVAYQAGVLRALHEAGITFEHGDGASGGTINLAMLLSGITPAEMCARWSTLDPKKFVSLPPLRELLDIPDLAAWGDADGVRHDVFPHLGIDVEAIRQHQGMRGTFNVCNFSTKTVEVIPHTDIDLDLLIAGISLPILMPAVHTRGTWYTDAVWIKDANVDEAIRQGADEVWLVWCIGNTPEYQNGSFAQYVHMIEMAANGSLFAQFTRVEAMNARIARGESVDGRTTPVTLHVIKPELPIPLDPDYYLGRVSGTTLVEMGYADAWRYLRARTPAGIPWTPEATRMQQPHPGLTFAEVMLGDMAMGATDPKAIDKGAVRRQAPLAIHVTVHIDDIERFVTDASHPGRLTGHVSSSLFGGDIMAMRGVFNLFSPTDDPRLTLMVYELGFTYQNTPYYLAGRKEVRNDPGFDLWSDTTTLFTTLHHGSDTSGPVMGAGVLRLGVAELFQLVRNMHATNTSTVAEAGHVIERFGRFFLGSLWASYGPSSKAATTSNELPAPSSAS